MRNAFADEIEQLAAADSRVVLLSGDIGNRLFDKFKERFPDRFYNCGVAEANMVNMAAGLAMTGLRPVVYTIASFLVFRPYEQIRINIGYHDLPVVLVGVGGGLSYASNGPTHHSLDDINVIRSVPNFQILNAGDSWEVRACLNAALESPHPTYLRIGKKREPVVHPKKIEGFAFGTSIPICEGDRATLIVSGNLLPIAQEAAVQTSASLISFPSVHPLDETTLERLFTEAKPVVVIEEHSEIGGLGSAVLEWAYRNGYRSDLLHRIATPHRFVKRTTDHQDARQLFELTSAHLTRRIAKLFA